MKNSILTAVAFLMFAGSAFTVTANASQTKPKTTTTQPVPPTTDSIPPGCPRNDPNGCGILD